jgi:hypothetical protein
MSSRFDDILGRHRGSGGDRPPAAPPPPVERLRRLARHLLGSYLGNAELRQLASTAGTLAVRGTLLTSKQRERPVVIVGAPALTGDDDQPFFGLLLLELDDNGQVTGSIVFRYDSTHEA